MEKKENMPMWVFLAFSSINTRRGALILIWSCVVFTLYAVPWGLLFPDYQWLGKFFLINDWSWLLTMLPVILWYWLCLRWVDKHNAWVN